MAQKWNRHPRPEGAGAGEALITEEASAAAGLTEDLERRDLTVEGREERARVWVLRVGEPAPVAPC
jgi:hypothetical protein